MERTKNRVMVQGGMSLPLALIYATLLGVAGFSLLYVQANPLSAYCALIGFVVYVGFYSLCSSVNRCTAPWSAACPVPCRLSLAIVLSAISFDLAAVTLLVMFSLWQMPHSFAIAIFRFKDYSAANIPVLRWRVASWLRRSRSCCTCWHRACHLDAHPRRLRRPRTWPWQLPWAFTGCTWLGVATRPKTTSKWARKVFGFSILTVTWP
ncbi:hypothetical protein GTA07_29725 [Rhodococcus hoagii]|nr:hypothetical protein [Prescottella equi]